MNKLSRIENNTASDLATMADQDSRERHHYPLQFLIYGASALLVLVTIVLSSVVSWEIEQKWADQQSQTAADDSVRTLQSRLASILSEASNSATKLASGGLANTRLIDDSYRLILSLEAARSALPHISTVKLLDDNQRVTTVTETGYDVSTRDTRDAMGNDRYAHILGKIAQQRGPIWLEPYFDSTLQDHILEVWVPARAGEMRNGALGMSMTLRGLSAKLGLDGAKKSTPFVLSTQGAVLAAPTYLGNKQENASTPSMEKMSDAIMAIQSAASSTPRGVRRGGNDDMDGSRHAEIRIDGSDYATTFRRMMIAPQMAWIVGTVTPSERSEHRAEWIRSSGITYLIVIAILLPICWVVAKFIAGQVKTWVEFMNRMATLEFQSSLPKGRSRIREIDDLIKSFATMFSSFRALQPYVPKKLIPHLVAAGGDGIPSEQREIAVLFTDIAGFTKMSEEMSPGDIAALLNEHFEVLVRQIGRHGGTVDKYIGDSVMAFWGAPDNIDNPSEMAVAAALKIADEFELLNSRRAKAGKPPIEIRIGVHYGPALVGNIGASERFNYTAVGDTVNAAQRIESLAKDVINKKAVTIVVSENVAEHLPNSMPTLEVGKALLVGKKTPVSVFLLKH